MRKILSVVSVACMISFILEIGNSGFLLSNVSDCKAFNINP